MIAFLTCKTAPDICFIYLVSFPALATELNWHVLVTWLDINGNDKEVGNAL
ncbi:MAG: hypothetical protein R3C03_05665 [Pirellulaceae bacterium]